jgi:hypothetical protein
VTPRSPGCSRRARRACRPTATPRIRPRTRSHSTRTTRTRRRRCCASTTSSPSSGTRLVTLRRASCTPGSLQNAQNASTDQFDQGDNALKTAIQNFLAKNTQDASAANNAYDFNAAQALGQSVQNAPSNPLYSPAASAAIDPASVGLKFPLAPGYELYRDPVTGELKARKV